MVDQLNKDEEKGTDAVYLISHLIMFLYCFSLESVMCIYAPRLMVSPVDEHSIRVQPLARQDEESQQD